jgi:excisionase family DNA binding protein
LGFILIINLTKYRMSKEIRKDLYTQSEYAKLMGVSRSRINQLVKAGELKTVTVNGGILVKLA